VGFLFKPPVLAGLTAFTGGQAALTAAFAGYHFAGNLDSKQQNQ
jgi:hypothetical protein